MPAQAVRLYCCYAERNRADWDELTANMAILTHLGMIEIRHNHDVLVGHNALQERHNCLETADIVLLLISHYFFASDSCWELMCQAMTRHNLGTLQVVPVLLSLVDYEGAPIDKLQMLPRDRPIKQWPNRQAAYVDVIRNIREIIEMLYVKQKEQEQCSNE